AGACDRDPPRRRRVPWQGHRMLKEIKVEWDTFNFKVYVVIGPYAGLRAYVKKRHRRVYRERKVINVCGLYIASKPLCGGILWLPKVPRSPKELGYLAHEIGHAVWDMCDQRGINLDTMNDETFCYAIGHGVTAVLKRCK